MLPNEETQTPQTATPTPPSTEPAPEPTSSQAEPLPNTNSPVEPAGALPSEPQPPVTVPTPPVPPANPTPIQTNAAPEIPGQPIANSPVVGGSFVNEEAPKPKAKRSLKAAILALVAVLLLGAVGGGYYFWNKQQTSPDHVFQAAINDAFMTKTVTQTADDGSGTTGTVLFDISNVKNPKISISGDLKSSGLNFNFKGYGTLKNTYISYTSLGNSTIDGLATSIINKWVQMRTNGALPSGVDSSVNDIVDPRYGAFGDLLFGNLSATDRANLTNYAISNQVYKYDPKAVTTSTLNSRKVYVYTVSENTDKLKELNKKFAAIMGIPASDIQSALNDINSGTVKLYVEIGSKHFVKYVASQNGTTVTGTYSNYDATALPGEPTADITWEQFQQKQQDLLSQILGGNPSLLNSLTTPSTTQT